MNASPATLIRLFLLATAGMTFSAKSESAESPTSESPPSQQGPTNVKQQPAKADEGWKPLIKKAELAPWVRTNFGGEGEVEVKDGILTLHIGSPLTGVTYDLLDFPKDNYEMRWEARRVSGQDFFAGVTFPVGEEFCSFVGGGWGGSLTGLSSINGYDASENDTTGSELFENNRWYKFRLRVAPKTIQVWLDDKEIINVEREGNQFSTRIEMYICQPVGYCTYDCTAEIRGWEFRRLDEPAKAKPATSAIPAKEPLEFVRILTDDAGEPKSLQTSISSYAISDGPFAGAQIDLIGAVHVAEREYYAELNRRFRDYESLLFELVADPNVRLDQARKDRGVYNPLSALQVGMKDALKLSFQLDEIDYNRKNFVHADMTPDEFVADMQKRKDNLLSTFARVLGSSIAAQADASAAGADAKILAALMSKNQAASLRRAMAEQFENMEVQLGGLADRQGKSTLVTERNRKAFEVLRQQLESGKRKLAVFYGAAHLKDMDARLVSDFGAKRGATIWLDAWKLDLDQRS